MKLKGIQLKGVRVNKEGKIEKAFIPRDASHALRAKKSKKQRPLRRVV